MQRWRDARALHGLAAGAPRTVLLDEVFSRDASRRALPPLHRTSPNSDTVTIIYTSGTSGDAKGVILNVGNVNHMLSCTTARLDLLMGPRHASPDSVFPLFAILLRRLVDFAALLPLAVQPPAASAPI